MFCFLPASSWQHLLMYVSTTIHNVLCFVVTSLYWIMLILPVYFWVIHSTRGHLTIALMPVNCNSLWMKLPPFRRRHFQLHFHDWKYYMLIQISLKFVTNGSTDYKSTLVQIMACRLNQCWSSSLTHICGTRDRGGKQTWGMCELMVCPKGNKQDCVTI